jgi:hypothetical protein
MLISILIPNDSCSTPPHLLPRHDSSPSHASRHPPHPLPPHPICCVIIHIQIRAIMPMRRTRRRVLRQRPTVSTPIREPRAHKPSRRRVLRFGAHMVLRHRARERIHGHGAREGRPSHARGADLPPAVLVGPYPPSSH